MKNLIFVLINSLLLLSCVNHEKECAAEIEKIEKYENRLKEIYLSRVSLPVDLPSPKPKEVNSNGETLEIGVSKEGKYFFSKDPDAHQYYYEQLEPILSSKMDSQIEKVIKISGDKDASFESILQLIALAKSKEWKPILTYKED